MPELPEVETIARALRIGGRVYPDGSVGQAVQGQIIQSAAVLWPRTVAYPTAAEVEAHLPGQSILQIGRRGKFLVFSLDRDHLLIHLRMSGDLIVEPVDRPLAPHHRFWIGFQDGLRLVFNDPRKFGRIWLTRDPENVLGGLGPEPLSPEFTPQEFFTRLQKYHRQLKPLLLDQSFLAGLGNIYSDEALHRARLHPLRLSHTLQQEDAGRLWQAIREVLEEGILKQGSSIDWVYRGGDFQDSFRAYQRTGQPCPNCGTPIERIVVGQRSTHYCPHCQSIDR